MECEAGIEFRSVKQMPNALSATHSERLSAVYGEGSSAACSATMPTLSVTKVDTVDRKRASSSSMDDVKWKRQRLAPGASRGMLSARVMFQWFSRYVAQLLFDSSY